MSRFFIPTPIKLLAIPTIPLAVVGIVTLVGQSTPVQPTQHVMTTCAHVSPSPPPAPMPTPAPRPTSAMPMSK